MRYIDDFPDPGPLRRGIEDARLADETAILEALLGDATFPPKVQARIARTARRLVEDFRKKGAGHGPLDAFLHEYKLSDHEGVVLMCLAEALLRIPDAETADRLIHDKLTDADWEQHLGKSQSLFVNFSTWALMLTGRIIDVDDQDPRNPGSVVKRLVAKSGEPVIRQAMIQAMRILGRQFVMGRTIGEALGHAREEEDRRDRISFDMLGEAARTSDDAERYFQAYADAIGAIGASVDKIQTAGADVIENPGISVKLSALHPRYELAQRHRVMAELLPRLKQLALQARKSGIGLCVDAEEAALLDLSLDLFEKISADPDLDGWDGFGLAVQAYQKRSSAVLDWLADVAKRHRRRLMVRLVKGAYWDTEIKRAQEQGLDGYPVFTRKVSTDVSYLACARKLLAQPHLFYPQFATHNAHTINRALAERPGSIVPLIAETGGQNAMIVDSTALPEQVVDDVVTSAFLSAGQRCSALRVLFVQDDVSERVIGMLTGAMAELAVGDPALLATDVGPVIDGDSLSRLENHARRMDREGTLLARTPLTVACAEGTFFAPAAYQIERLDLLQGEVFGPILHVISYAADRLDGVIEAVNGTGFGLTLGIHSRVGETQRYIQQRVKAGNAYVNRSMIGAAVGVQPFGGEGLSGTGPKAGGPRYLHRFAVERTLSVDTAAAGGNAALMSLEE